VIRIAPAHRAVATDHEQDVDAEPLQAVDDLLRVLWPAGGAQHGAAVDVDVPNALRRQIHQLVAVGGDETLVAVAEADDAPHPVVVGQVADQAADDVVETGAQPAAGHDPGPGLGRVEENLASRAGRLEAGQAADRTATRPDHAQGVVEEYPVTLVDIVFRGLPGVEQRSQRGLDPGRPEGLDRQIRATGDGGALARRAPSRDPMHPTGHLMLLTQRL
jgi:hypothetical protein